MLNNNLKYVIFFGLAALSAVPANAETADDAQPQARVTYSDLNLTTSEGSEALQRRVLSAAATVCARPIANWLDQLSQRSCERKVIEAAKPQVQEALLSARHAFAMRSSEATVLAH